MALRFRVIDVRNFYPPTQETTGLPVGLHGSMEISFFMEHGGGVFFWYAPGPDLACNDSI